MSEVGKEIKLIDLTFADRLARLESGHESLKADTEEIVEFVRAVRGLVKLAKWGGILVKWVTPFIVIGTAIITFLKGK